MKSVRILSLGEIITPNLNAGIKAVGDLIAAKNETDPKIVTKTIQTNIEAIEDFKKGKIDEETFDNIIIDQLEKYTGVRITVEEWNQCWDKMNPSYEEFKGPLNDALCIKNTQLIFISSTNPKDIRHLMKQLDGKIAYTMRDGILVEIDGIPVHTSYAVKKTKPQLIMDVIKDIKGPDRWFAAAEQKDDKDIAYIKGFNKIKLEEFRQTFDKTSKQVAEAAENLRVKTIIWNKDEIPTLTGLLKSQKLDTQVLLYAHL